MTFREHLSPATVMTAHGGTEHLRQFFDGEIQYGGGQTEFSLLTLDDPSVHSTFGLENPVMSPVVGREVYVSSRIFIPGPSGYDLHRGVLVEASGVIYPLVIKKPEPWSDSDYEDIERRVGMSPEATIRTLNRASRLDQARDRITKEIRVEDARQLQREIDVRATLERYDRSQRYRLPYAAYVLDGIPTMLIMPDLTHFGFQQLGSIDDLLSPESATVPPRSRIEFLCGLLRTVLQFHEDQRFMRLSVFDIIYGGKGLWVRRNPDGRYAYTLTDFGMVTTEDKNNSINDMPQKQRQELWNYLFYRPTGRRSFCDLLSPALMSQSESGISLSLDLFPPGDPLGQSIQRLLDKVYRYEDVKESFYAFKDLLDQS